MYIPKSIKERNSMIMEVAQATNTNPDEIFKKYVSFGPLFNNDIARTNALTYLSQGQPSLTADGMMATVIQSGKLLWFRYIEQSAERCVMEAKRSDFPSDVPPQRVEYTIEDAARQGLTKRLGYQKMPQRMLTSRCKTNLCRDLFPDVTSGYYSVDEIMDSQNMDDKERAKIAAVSLGEEIDFSSPPDPIQKKRIDQPADSIELWSDEPKKKHHEIEYEQIATTPTVSTVEPAPYTHRATPTPLISFHNTTDLQTACEYNYIPLEEVNEVAKRLGIHLDRLSGDECKNFFYTWCLSSSLRKIHLKDNWWRNISEGQHAFKSLYHEFAALKDVTERQIGQMMGNGDFWEAVKVSAHFTGHKLEEARRIVKDLAKGKVDPSACAYLTSL